ncbi:transcriptional regulator [Neptunitalea chrysea]|uniref:Transcriptional regulator n=1 Tax=Neptunitalea chrysea TaxID=1647581 RepID=A0A9W6B941_9FLAO|nr:helix-turn-helix transcriptional regulator [Neptunitalea chrysea]GLB54102.1 transcriptional regulator [Neptunitalea chrysea]
MEINRIKAVLAESGKKNKWLSAKMRLNEATVSKWCTNASQPSLKTLKEIAKVLGVDIRELLNQTKN